MNAVAPGILDPPGAGEALVEKIPLRRFGTHAEAVEAVLFLAAGAATRRAKCCAWTAGGALAMTADRRQASFHAWKVENRGEHDVDA